MHRVHKEGVRRYRFFGDVSRALTHGEARASVCWNAGTTTCGSLKLFDVSWKKYGSLIFGNGAVRCIY